MAARHNIAVIGAGIGGLAAATALVRTGHRVTLYEHFVQSRPVGSGLLLQPTGLAALDRLGLRARIAALGARIDRLHGITARGRIVFDLAYADLDPALSAIAVHRAALHGVLWDAFAASGATLETGRTIVGVDTGPAGRLFLLDGAGQNPAAQKHGPFDLVVDAAGTHSPLRAVVSGQSARAFVYGAVWANVIDIGLAPNTLAQRYVAARQMLGYLPVGRMTEDGPALAALFWSLKPTTHASWAADFPAWRAQATQLWPELGSVIAGLTGPEAFTLAEYQHFTARRPVRGPIVLIGDAAHATSPQLGQGANHALLDALALSDALNSAVDIASALAAYASARRAHVRFYQRASALMTPLFQSDSSLAATLRDVSFHRLSRFAYLRREMVRMLAGLKTGIFTSRDPARLAGMGLI